MINLIMNQKRYLNFCNFIAVEDGTGVVEINYKLEQYLFLLKQRQEIDEKYRNQAENLRETKIVKNCPKKFPEIRPEFTYPCNTPLQDIAVSLRAIMYMNASYQITSFHVYKELFHAFQLFLLLYC